MIEEEDIKYYIPKEITQQPKFLRKYPDYDGRNVLIAIVDFGIDVSLPGLQKTSTGLPKIVDVFDFTGDGDVDSSTVKKSKEGDLLIGLTGRHLKIPKTWNNPSGEWHLGIKSIYELYSENALENMTGYRKANIARQNETLRQSINLEKENKLFEAYLKSTEDLSKESLVADCIVWHDGDKWRAAIDTSFCGNLENVKVLTNFRDEYEYGFISETDKVCYCLNIYKNGNLLEINTSRLSHGSMVAQVAAAHFPNEPKKDGLAPGAQIVFMNIVLRKHFSRRALMLALEKCVEMKVDIINCSFDTNQNKGIPLKYLKKVSEKHGILIVAGVGNNGPCLSSISCSDGLVLNVGAIVSSKMKNTFYNTSDKTTPAPYFWSSRGPMLNGYLGIDLIAPGAVIVDLPKSFKKNRSYFHGTSLSTPKATGNIACLISGLKANSIPYSPFGIKLALTNTALSLENHDKLSSGYGAVQILSAFEFAKNYLYFVPKNLTNIQISVLSDKPTISAMHGIYLVQNDSSQNVTLLNIEMQHSFTNWSSVIKTPTNFLLQSCINASKFVKHPKSIQIPFPINEKFWVKIDTTNLEPGKCHYAEICGRDPLNLYLGPIFRIPITIVIPEKVTKENNYVLERKISLKPDIPYRFILQPPPNCYQCFLKVWYLNKKPIELFYFSTKDEKPRKSFHLFSENNYQNDCIWFEPEKALEICLFKHSKFEGTSNFKIQIEFYGSFISPKSVLINNFKWLLYKKENHLQVANNYLRDSKSISYSLQLEKCRFSLNTIKGVLNNCERKSVMDGNDLHCLILHYEFKVETRLDYRFFAAFPSDIVIRLTEGFTFKIYTSSKNFITHFCVQEKDVKLEKGEYFIVGKIWCSMPLLLKDYEKFRVGIELNLKTSVPHKLKYCDPEKFKPNKDGGIEINKEQELMINYDSNFFEKICSSLPSETFYFASLCQHFCESVYKHPDHIMLKSFKPENCTSTFIQKSILTAKNYFKMENEKDILSKNFKSESIGSNKMMQCLVQINHFYEKKDLESVRKYVDYFLNLVKNGEVLNVYETENHSSNISSSKFYINFNCIFNLHDRKMKTLFSFISKILPNMQKLCVDMSPKICEKSDKKENEKRTAELSFYGTALFIFNEIANENKTIEDYKFLEEAIIEILKHLKWDHLVEAHEKAYLNRHRKTFEDQDC